MTEQQQAQELFAMDLAEQLWYNCCADLFPEEAAETIYGIKMGNELGTVVFACWSYLLKNIIVRVPSVADAMLHGTLPALYAANVQAQQHANRYCARQVFLGFRGIPWDLHFHSSLTRASGGASRMSGKVCVPPSRGMSRKRSCCTG